jgi:hypothetical protein
MKKILLAAVVALVAAGPAHAAQFTFGTTTVSGAAPVVLDADRKAVAILTSPKAGTLAKVEIYLDGKGATHGTQKLRSVAYTVDGSGNPVNLLGTSNEVTIQAKQQAGWVAFTFPYSVPIPAGRIAFGYLVGATTRIARTYWDSTGTRVGNTDTYADGASNPFGAGTSASPAMALKVTGDEARFGISAGANLVYEDDATRQRELDNMRTANAKWVRMDFAWSVIEPTQGAFNVGYLDTAVTEAAARGLSVVAMVGYAPAWANGGFTDDKYPPTNPADYASIAGRLAAHFGPLGVHVYEIWNEPNIDAFWKPTPNVAQYAAIVSQGYTAIHANDPAAFVLAGVMSPHGGYHDSNCDGTPDSGQDPTGYDPLDFLEGMYANGAAGKFDALSHHPYERFVGLNFHVCSAWSQMAQTTPSLTSIMASHGDGAKKLWATEYGNAVPDWVDEATQASRLDQAMQAWKTYTWAGNFLEFNLWDSSGSKFGLLRSDWSQRPAFGVFQTDAL